jgi:glycosyltransferase involved in cell wall biosynthesis
MTDPLGQSQVLPYLIGLSKMGCQFTLLSFEKKDRFQQLSKKIQTACSENNIRWVPLLFTSKPPVLSKIYDNWKIKRKVLQLHHKHNFDFTHCRSYVAASAGLTLFNKKRIPFLFDMRGFWVDERVDNGQWDLKNPLYSFFYRIYKRKERKYLFFAKHIISLTQKGKDELVSAYRVDALKISVIPCCVDLAHFDYSKIDLLQQDKLKKVLGISENNFILSYLGSLGGWYMTREMLDFFKQLKSSKQEAKFLFITHDKKEKILQMAAEAGICPEDIIVQPASRQEVPLLLSLSHWSIFFIKDAYSKKASSPTKQGEIMAMGIPIICNDIGDTGKIISESAAGVLINRFSTDEYIRTVGLLKINDNLPKEKIRESAGQYYSLTTGIGNYFSVYKEISVN